jgi:hypothetical protein
MYPTHSGSSEISLSNIKPNSTCELGCNGGTTGSIQTPQYESVGDTAEVPVLTRTQPLANRDAII